MAQLVKNTDIPKENLITNYKLAAEKDAQKVRGKFIFHECPGGQMDFVYRKYKSEPLTKYSLKDGEVVTIPLGVARHLNAPEHCSYPNYSYKNDEQGRPVVQITQRIRRCSFQSLEFMDIDVAPVSVIPSIPSPLGT
jgi:hypothetical protein